MLVSSMSFSMLVNGFPSSFFKDSIGLRQGDPISPILFIILAECLGIFDDHMVLKGDFVGLNPSSLTLVCSHQQFFDDSIVIGEASVKNARSIKKALVDYGNATGQLINWNKSLIYFMNVSVERQMKIKNIISCEIGSLLGSYLGLPLGLSPPNNLWNSLIDKIHLKLAGWKGFMLSQAGKVVVLKSILKSVLLYALRLFKIPRKYALAIEKIQKTFLWTGMENKKRLPLIAWENVCMPYKKGGLSL